MFGFITQKTNNYKINLLTKCNTVRMLKKGVIDFASEIKRVESHPDFVHINQHDLQGFIVKNIKGESMEANHVKLLRK